MLKDFIEEMLPVYFQWLVDHDHMIWCHMIFILKIVYYVILLYIFRSRANLMANSLEVQLKGRQYLVAQWVWWVNILAWILHQWTQMLWTQMWWTVLWTLEWIRLWTQEWIPLHLQACILVAPKCQWEAEKLICQCTLTGGQAHTPITTCWTSVSLPINRCVFFKRSLDSCLVYVDRKIKISVLCSCNHKNDYKWLQITWKIFPSNRLYKCIYITFFIKG